MPPRGPHPARRRHVEPYDAADGVVRVGAVHRPPVLGAPLDELVDGRGEALGPVLDRAQPSVRVGAEPDPLRRGAAVADEGEHLAPGHDDPDRAVQHGRGHRGGDGVGAGPLGTEAASHVFGPHPNRLRVEREQFRQFVGHEPAALVGVDHLEAGHRPTARPPHAAPWGCGAPPGCCTRRPRRRRTRRVRPPGRPSSRRGRSPACTHREARRRTRRRAAPRRTRRRAPRRPPSPARVSRRRRGPPASRSTVRGPPGRSGRSGRVRRRRSCNRR